MTPAHRHLLSRVGMLVLATVALDLAGSAAIYLLERGARGTGIHTLGDALFWTSTQLTTVSSQLPNPASTTARILDVALLAGSFAAFFHGRSGEHSQAAAREPEVRAAARRQVPPGSSASTSSAISS